MAARVRRGHPYPSHWCIHTSGLRDFGAALSLQGRESETLDFDQVLAVIKSFEQGNHAPGEVYEYSNSGYVLLGHIVERVSGKPLGAFLEENVFAPLGMRDTFIPESPSTVDPRLARAYSPNDAQDLVLDEPRHLTKGASDIHTTIADLQRWDENLLLRDGRWAAGRAAHDGNGHAQ